MTEIFVPLRAAEAEIVEKRSRFIGSILPVSSEEEARAHIEAVKKRHRDARHNCWCYRLESGVERYSDDGEPQGTAGVPMLSVFQKADVTNLCCVVTRYFGGVLLGAGGLVRAYSQTARDTLDAAGVGKMQPWTRLSLTAPYPLLEQLKLLCAQCDGAVEDIVYADQAALILRFPSEKVERFTSLVTELTAGSLSPEVLGEFMAASVKA